MLSEKSLKKLEGVNPLLVSVLGAAAVICPIEFQISEGVRDFEHQKMLYDAGKSKTLKSHHLIQRDGFGSAADVVVVINGRADWNMDNYRKVADSVKIAALQLGIPVEWGGDWKTFKDGPHFQLVK